MKLFSRRFMARFAQNGALLMAAILVCGTVLEAYISRFVWYGECELDRTIPFGRQQAPNARYSYQGAVFAYDTRHNSDGFRERELPTTRYSDGKRVVFIGDSFAYGWGVNNPSCFVRRTEKYLQAADGEKAWDVLNLGVFGTHVIQYRDILFSYGRQLQPDIVVICLYLPNDAVHWYWEPKRNQRPTRFMENLLRLRPEHTISLVSNVYKWRKQHPGVAWADAQERNPLAELLASDDPVAKAKVDALDPLIREMCLKWELSPYHPAYAITRENDMLAYHIDTNNNNIRSSFPPKVLQEMRDEVKSWGGELRFLFIPMGWTIEEGHSRSFEKFRYIMRPALLRDHRIQDTYAHFSKELGIPFLNLRPYLLNQPAREYLDLDDHFTVYGHGVMANLISRWLLGKLAPAAEPPAPPRRPEMREIKRWDAKNLAEWKPDTPKQPAAVNDSGLNLKYMTANVPLRDAGAALNCAEVNRFRVRMKADKGRFAQLYWGFAADKEGAKKAFSEKRVAVFPIHADGAFHEYDVALDHASADYSGVWQELQFYPAALDKKEGDSTGTKVDIEWIALGHCEPNPEAPSAWEDS